MALIQPGVWHDTLWADRTWQDNLWLEYGVEVLPRGGGSQIWLTPSRKISPRLLRLLVMYLEMKLST